MTPYRAFMILGSFCFILNLMIHLSLGLVMNPLLVVAGWITIYYTARELS